MTDEQKQKKAERDRRYREKKKLAEAAIAPNEHYLASGMPEVPAPKPEPQAPIAPAPSQLDRIEALLLELVRSNRKLHPEMSELLGGFKG